MKQRILIGSPICQTPAILTLFLQSIERLDGKLSDIHYLFIDNNSDPLSRQLLQEFAGAHQDKAIIMGEDSPEEAYFRDNTTHYWTDSLIWKVARYKNRIIDYALDHDYDALFLIDSDLLLHPDTLHSLIHSGKPIISEIFWTSWQPHTIPLPQVWVSDEYTMFERNGNEKLTKEQEVVRQHLFLGKLRVPGVYEVGGLGACTLIRKEALMKGINFSKINNLSFWGEDRHFCVRAQALGLQLYVDTHYPAFHIYRETDLLQAEAWTAKHNNETPGSARPERQQADLRATSKAVYAAVPPRPRVMLSMIVRNEAEKFLRPVLEQHRKYIDEAVIIDDGSTDNSVDICREVLEGIPLHLICNQETRFTNEVQLRKQQWEETIKRKPEWILNMDADEIFEDAFAEGIEDVLRQTSGDVGCFRLYDMWSASEYREDEYWRAHHVYRPMLLRYREHHSCRWKEQPLHCGRFPDNIFELPSFTHPYRVKHLGWSTPAIRAAKYDRYLQLDPDGRYGWREQYESILDAKPRLLKWSEQA
ncbi:glycosyltransferase [Paenibacillus sp. YIM B09110]|uniref:glycosyltransferase n=1 Tax=Paenibacillus sp. YIM B09110 TaxID=3126102 RepID=UPI00301C095C